MILLLLKVRKRKSKIVKTGDRQSNEAFSLLHETLKPPRSALTRSEVSARESRTEVVTAIAGVSETAQPRVHTGNLHDDRWRNGNEIHRRRKRNLCRAHTLWLHRRSGQQWNGCPNRNSSRIFQHTVSAKDLHRYAMRMMFPSRGLNNLWDMAIKQ